MTDFNAKNIKLIAGLGNPGNKYKNTYHNVGKKLIEILLSDSLIGNTKRSENSLFTIWETTHPTAHKKLILAETKVFMNKSGQAIKELIDYFEIPPESILIAHDDSDISLGNYKISFNRGSAGHKGIVSIANFLNSKKFWRARIGVRSSKENRKAENFVLNKISSDHKKEIERAMQNVKSEILPA